jgi:hypothetical protein
MTASEPLHHSMSATTTTDAQREFDDAIRSLEAEVSNVGAHLTLDAAARQAYARQIRAVADELKRQVAAGELTWEQAAAKAQQTRNAIMQVIRGRSTPVGRAIAEALKKEGKTLNELIARKTLKLYGPQARFDRLAGLQQDAIYAEIVHSAGSSNPTVTSMMRNLSLAGRGLLVLSIALSVYTIAMAEDKAAAARREGAITGAGIAGGMAAGALAGLVCGPGAPVCVGIGAFAGGALAAFGVASFW